MDDNRRMLIVDGHEDLAYNAFCDGRDYLRSALETRKEEAGGPVEEGNGRCMLGLPEWLAGGVGIVVATLFTMPRSEANKGEMSYANAEAAHLQALAQLEVYRSWAERHPQIELVTDVAGLDAVLESWDNPAAATSERRVGLVILMENADPIRRPEETEEWHARGVRLIGPAWATTRYAASTMDGGPLSDRGRELVREMDRLGMALDLTHMAEEACLEALSRYAGPVVASHANPQSMVPMHRMLPDAVIDGVIEHDGVVGIMPANWALDPTWREHHDRSRVHLDTVADAIDAVCQRAGNARHAGLGTDFDGGFGAEAVPAELDTIADLPRIGDALRARGYAEEDMLAIMSGNWLRVLRAVL